MACVAVSRGVRGPVGRVRSGAGIGRQFTWWGPPTVPNQHSEGRRRMMSSLTGGVLRGLAGIAFVVLVPLSAAAQDPLTCRAWTDNPIVSGSTPLKAQHINELRVCLERIIQHLGVMPVDPVGDISVTEVIKEGCWIGEVCIYATLTNNSTQEVTVYPWVRVYDVGGQLLWVYELSRSSIVSGGQVRRTLVRTDPDWHTERRAAHYTIELTTRGGVPILCSGCGRFPW